MNERAILDLFLLGSGAVIAINERTCIVSVTERLAAFYCHESCGKCFPCRIGTQRLTERLSDNGEHRGPNDLDAWLAEVDDISFTMKEISACGLGMAAPMAVESLMRYFPEQVERHVLDRNVKRNA